MIPFTPSNLAPGTTQRDICGPSHEQCRGCGETFSREQLDPYTGLCEGCHVEEIKEEVK